MGASHQIRPDFNRSRIKTNLCNHSQIILLKAKHFWWIKYGKSLGRPTKIDCVCDLLFRGFVSGDVAGGRIFVFVYILGARRWRNWKFSSCLAASVACISHWVVSVMDLLSTQHQNSFDFSHETPRDCPVCHRHQRKCKRNLQTQFPRNQMSQQQHSEAQDKGLPGRQLHSNVAALSALHEERELQRYRRSEVRCVSGRLQHHPGTIVAQIGVHTDGERHGFREVSDEARLRRLSWSWRIPLPGIHHLTDPGWSCQHQAQILLHSEEGQGVFVQKRWDCE
jgi:hypothetical protein